MTSQRLLQRTLKLTLIALVIGGVGGVHSQPKAGDWKIPTAFGEFVFTVNPAGTRINKLILSFSSWRCGPVSHGGTISIEYTVGGPLISNRQFTIEEYLDFPSRNEKLTIRGTFNANGDVASGTWSAVIYGTTCSGNWGPAGPGVSAVDMGGGIPEEFALGQNYPNPFNPTTSIKYQIPNTSHVTLKVFNTLGQEVATLVDAIEEPGFKSVQFDARLPGGQGSRLSSGVYMYRLQAGDCVATRKLLILK